MGDLSTTAASVLAGATAKKAEGIAGATIVAGQWLYADSTDNYKLKLADCDSSAATANCVGCALHGAGSGQPLIYVWEDDDFTPGGTLTLSVASAIDVLVLSGTAGAAQKASDLAALDYPMILGVVKSTTKMNLKLIRGTAALTA